MKELLEKILATEVLSEETKAEISTAFTQLIEEQVEAAKAEAEADVRATLAEQWITERDVLIEALDQQVTEIAKAEFDELKEDVARFRDLEVEYASKLVEAREDLAGQLDADIHTLAEQLDEYIGLKFKAEMDELSESIQEVRQNELGRKAFELFAREYQQSFVNKSDIEKQLAESQKEIAAVKVQLKESEARIATAHRAGKMDELLASLSGKTRNVMETILKSVPTEKLEESFEMFLPRVIKESKRPAQENEVLAESADNTPSKDILSEGVVVTGNHPADQNQNHVDQPIVEQQINPELQKLAVLAGIAD